MTIPKNLNIINLSAKLVREASEFIATSFEDDSPTEKIVTTCMNIFVSSLFILAAFLVVAFFECMFFDSGFAGFILFLAFAFYLCECMKHYDD